jgi:hypothetical protein
VSADRVVAKHGVDAADAVHELGNTKVDDGARKRKGVEPREGELTAHQLQHRIGRERRRFVEILIEPRG